MTQIINPDAWPRKELFGFFSGISNPFYSVTFKLDVTRLYEFTKEQGLSFYYSLIYLSTNAINSVEAFRCALEGGEPVLLDRRSPSFTDLHPGSESFHIVTMPCEGSIQDLCRSARERSRAQKTLLSQADTKDLIYFSCLPWVELTALTNERDFDPDDNIPRLAWGKYNSFSGRKILHFSMELNHRFVDGVHIGRFNESLCAQIESL